MPNEKPNYQNSQQDKNIARLEENQEVLQKDFYSHMAKFNTEMGDIKTDVGQIKTDLEWIKKSYWVIATASVGALAGTLISLIGK